MTGPSSNELKLTPAEAKAYFLARVPGLKEQGTEWRAPCPVHGGKRADSLSVNFEKGVARCFASCDTGWTAVAFERALTGVSLAKARQEVLRIVGRPAKSGKRLTDKYEYTDEQGRILFQVCRYVSDSGEKSFTQRRIDEEGRTIWNVKGVRRVPYRLPRVLAADRVLVVEDEKDVHTLEQLGFVATCNAGGAGKWKGELNTFFEGKDVVILPDNDEPGRKHSEQVYAQLTTVARRIRIVELPGLAPKGDVTDWLQAGGTPEQLRELIDQAETPDTAQVADLKEHFRVAPEGIYWRSPSSKEKDLWICPPLKVLALTRDFHDSGYGKLVEFTDTEGRTRQSVVAHTDLIADGNEALEQLIDQGFAPNRDRNARNRLKDFIWQSRPDRRVRCVDQIGWHGGAFVLPDRTIGSGDAEDVIFYSGAPPAHKLCQSGLLTDWQQHIARYCAGNSRLVFAVSSAFAAVLLSPLQHESAGFHLRGLSSTGKTTALRVAGTVWGGGGSNGYIDTWLGTANGLEVQAALHNDSLLCLDEISQVSENLVGDIIYFLGNGIAKTRATRIITLRRSQTFRLIYLSSGERRLDEMMSHAGRRAKGGQELRLVEIPADAGRAMGIFEVLHDSASPSDLARHLSAACATYYGTPIITFLDRLVRDLEQARVRARKIQREFVSLHVARDASGEVHRVALTLGLVAAAGELATDYGLTGWQRGEASWAIRKCFHDWLSARGSAGPLDVENGIKEVLQFVSQNHTSFHDHGCEPEQWPNIANPAGYRERAGKDDPDGEWIYYIHPKVFKQDICGAYDYRAVYQEMIRRGWARTNKGKDLPFAKKINGVGPRRFFVVLPIAFGEDES